MLTNCYAEHTPRFVPKECPQCPVPDPLVLDGVPVDYAMDSFPQQYIQCPSNEDMYNRRIKARNLWTDRDLPTRLTPRPEYKLCVPTPDLLYRKVRQPPSVDGAPETDGDLRYVPDESVLLALSRPLVENDTATRDLQGRQVCVDKRLAARESPDPELVRVYKETSVRPSLYEKQLFSAPDRAHNSTFKLPTAFRNCTKSRMNTN